MQKQKSYLYFYYSYDIHPILHREPRGSSLPRKAVPQVRLQEET